MEQTDVQALIDADHLKLLRLGYFLESGLSAFFGLFGLMYVGMGTLFSIVVPRIPQPGTNQLPPEFGWVFVLFGLVFMIFFLGMAALKLQVARCLGKRRSWLFCMIGAGFCCLGLPYGTILGVLTFLVLSRPSVRSRFDLQPPPVPQAQEHAGGA
jgi:hypothetical protein